MSVGKIKHRARMSRLQRSRRRGMELALVLLPKHTERKPLMIRRKQRDPDEKTPTPFLVLLGEFWDDRKRELAALTRRQLEAALEIRGIPLPTVFTQDHTDLLWMRLRLAYAEQIDFYLERGQIVPVKMQGRADIMDLEPGLLPPWSVNIFFDIDREGAEKRAITIQNNKIEAIIRGDEAELPDAN